jgi:hypothetical protein
LAFLTTSATFAFVCALPITNTEMFQEVPEGPKADPERSSFFAIGRKVSQCAQALSGAIGSTTLQTGTLRRSTGTSAGEV